MDNANSREYLDKIRNQVIENIRKTTFAPSVQLTEVPRDSIAMDDEDEAALDDLDDDQNPDKRMTQRRFDKQIEKNGELSDSEDEEMAEATGVRKQPGGRKRRNLINYRNIMDPLDSGLDSGIETPQAGSSLPDEDVNMEEAPTADAVEKEGATPREVPAESIDASRAQSPEAKAEEDVTMTDGDHAAAVTSTTEEQPTVQQEATPPESPPQETAEAAASVNGTEEPPTTEAKVKEEMAAEEAAAVAQEDGLREREEEDTAGQARTEEVSKS